MSDRRRRRRRPGRRAPRSRSCASTGYDGDDRPVRRRAAPALRAAAAVQGRACWARGRAESAFVHDAGVVRRPAGRAPHSATAVTGIDLDGAGSSASAPTSSTTTGCCSPPAPDPATLPAADQAGGAVPTCAPSTTAARLRGRSGPGRADLLIVGAGWIGLEVGRGRPRAGCEVDGRRAAAQPLLAGARAPRSAAVFADAAPRPRRRPAHRRSARSDQSTARRTARSVRLGDGPESPPTSCSSASASMPDDELARRPAWRVDNGVAGRRARCGPATRTSSPPATSPTTHHPVLGRRIRVEHWDNAIEQGRLAARNMLGGDESYDRAALLLHRPVRPRHGVRRHVGPAGYDEVVLRATCRARSRPSGARGRCSPACTSTTGTRSTRSARSSEAGRRRAARGRIRRPGRAGEGLRGARRHRVHRGSPPGRRSAPAGRRPSSRRPGSSRTELGLGPAVTSARRATCAPRRRSNRRR